MPHNRDPRKKSRTDRNRLTSSRDRSKRSKASAKDTPRPTSSKDRGKNKGSAKVTKSRIEQATSNIKRYISKEESAKRGAQGPRNPPSQTVKTKTQTQRTGLIGSRAGIPKTPPKPPLQGTPNRITGVKRRPMPPAGSRPARTNRGAQGPRTPPVQGPYQRNTGLIGSRKVPKPPKGQAPKPKFKDGLKGPKTLQQWERRSGTPPRPKGGTWGNMIRRLTGRGAVRKAGVAGGTLSTMALTAAYGGDGENLRNPVKKQKAIEKAKAKNREKDRRRNRQLGNRQGPEAPAGSLRPPKERWKPKMPPKRNKAVMSKKDGVEGYSINGKFIRKKWTTREKLRYRARGGN